MADYNYIALGGFSESAINSLLHQASGLADTGERIGFISAQFLGIPYKNASLIGGPEIPERFVIDLEGVDCLTFLEYVEAMRRSSSFEEFRDNLVKVRYGSAAVSFTSRLHFFSDWIETHTGHLQEASLAVGRTDARPVRKHLNRRPSGEPYVRGIPAFERTFHYIPRPSPSILQRLATGDYLGIYAEEDGLDVTHTGIVIVRDGRCFIRHASSSARHMKVVDEDLSGYMLTKPGMLILRAL